MWCICRSDYRPSCHEIVHNSFNLHSVNSFHSTLSTVHCRNHFISLPPPAPISHRSAVSLKQWLRHTKICHLSSETAWYIHNKKKTNPEVLMTDNSANTLAYGRWMSHELVLQQFFIVYVCTVIFKWVTKEAFSNRFQWNPIFSLSTPCVMCSAIPLCLCFAKKWSIFYIIVINKRAKRQLEQLILPINLFMKATLLHSSFQLHKVDWWKMVLKRNRLWFG